MITMVHLLGFSGSALIMISVMMSSITHLRLIAFTGSVAFIAYGILIGAWPVVITNVVTSSLHFHRLRELQRAGAGVIQPAISSG